MSCHLKKEKKYYRKGQRFVKGQHNNHYGKALQSQRELGNHSFAHQLNRINSSRLLKDNEHTNYFLRAQEQVEELLLCSDTITQARQVRNVIVKQSKDI